MTSVVLIEKLGNVKNISVKKFTLEELCKKAGFKTMTDFECQQVWDLDDLSTIHLFGKKNGRANQENKYEFPPPVDSILFFGSCILVRKNQENKEINLTADFWKKTCEQLQGGFEDIDSVDDEDSENECETEFMRKNKQMGNVTKAGYVKDDFVIDDDLEEHSETDCTDEEEPPAPIVTPKKRKSKKQIVAVIDEDSDEDLFLDCTSELCEEEYL